MKVVGKHQAGRDGRLQSGLGNEVGEVQAQGQKTPEMPVSQRDLHKKEA